MEAAVKIKVTDSQNITRRFTVPHPPPPGCWNALAASLSRRFATPSDYNFALQFDDEDGDVVTLSSEEELVELLQSTLSGASLRFNLVSLPHAHSTGSSSSSSNGNDAPPPPSVVDLAFFELVVGSICQVVNSSSVSQHSHFQRMIQVFARDALLGIKILDALKIELGDFEREVDGIAVDYIERKKDKASRDEVDCKVGVKEGLVDSGIARELGGNSVPTPQPTFCEFSATLVPQQAELISFVEATPDPEITTPPHDLPPLAVSPPESSPNLTRFNSTSAPIFIPTSLTHALPPRPSTTMLLPSHELPLISIPRPRVASQPPAPASPSRITKDDATTSSSIPSPPSAASIPCPPSATSTHSQVGDQTPIALSPSDSAHNSEAGGGHPSQPPPDSVASNTSNNGGYSRGSPPYRGFQQFSPRGFNYERGHGGHYGYEGRNFFRNMHGPGREFGRGEGGGGGYHHGEGYYRGQNGRGGAGHSVTSGGKVSECGEVGHGDIASDWGEGVAGQQTVANTEKCVVLEGWD